MFKQWSVKSGDAHKKGAPLQVPLLIQTRIAGQEKTLHVIRRLAVRSDVETFAFLVFRNPETDHHLDDE